MNKTIFFAVDCQNDFMNKDGALYVPNAESIKSNVKRLTTYAKKKGIKVIASMDKHYGTEEYKEKEGELMRWGGPFPDHCMTDTKGQEQIKETKLDGTEILEKQTYDVFSNPKALSVFNEIGKATVIVYGVATDYCVKAAVLGLCGLGYPVTVVKDAIMGVDKKTTEEAIAEMKFKGALFRSTKEVLK